MDYRNEKVGKNTVRLGLLPAKSGERFPSPGDVDPHPGRGVDLVSLALHERIGKLDAVRVISISVYQLVGYNFSAFTGGSERVQHQGWIPLAHIFHDDRSEAAALHL
jgi:hypothetical protein